MHGGFGVSGLGLRDPKPEALNQHPETRNTPHPDRNFPTLWLPPLPSTLCAQAAEKLEEYGVAAA